MSLLKQSLLQRIKLSGPISVSDFMAECLFNPTHGYYTTQQPFGAKGDFITAPAISQMFGELTAAWLIECWQQLGSPNPITLCEIGAGDATWMSDILRTISKTSPALCSVMDVVLIEKSKRLVAIQKQALKGGDVQLSWASSLNDLPDQPTLIIANELLDAVPTRQFVKTSDGWLERVITIHNEELVFGVGTATLDKNLLPLTATDAPDGTVFEYAPAREALVEEIALHISAHRGAGLFIDYGHIKSDFGDTLQAVQNHSYQNIFEAPGQADLTSHVDFEVLNIAAKSGGASIYKIITQADFLLALGLVERAGQLGAGQDAEVQTGISDAVHRLAGNADGQMGDLFKVMCITDKTTDAPPPFLTATTHSKNVDP